MARTEERLGAPLFERIQKGIRRTDEGRAVRVYAERIARLTEKTEQVAERKNDSSNHF